MRFILLFLLIYSCQNDNGFQDLTPKDDFNSSFFFNAPAFTVALNNIGKSPEADTTFRIERPEYLLPPRLNAVENGWITTDTFAFETGDFQRVLNLITYTAELNSIDIQSCEVSSRLGQVSLNGQPAWSVPERYYLVPYYLNNGERILIQITRTKAGGNSFFPAWKYTANGLWMIGEEKTSVVGPNQDVS